MAINLSLFMDGPKHFPGLDPQALYRYGGTGRTYAPVFVVVDGPCVRLRFRCLDTGMAMEQGESAWQVKLTHKSKLLEKVDGNCPLCGLGQMGHFADELEPSCDRAIEQAINAEER